jgi:hypothetical protein
VIFFCALFFFACGQHCATNDHQATNDHLGCDGLGQEQRAVTQCNWLFAGSLRAGQQAAAVMSLIQSAKLNGHDPYAYLKDVLARLPTHKNSHIEELLPHRWQPLLT